MRMGVFTMLVATSFAAGAAARSGAGQLTCNPAGSQAELNACAADERAAADAELNATWRQVLGQLKANPLATEKLRTAQRQWIKLRDMDLDAMFPLEPGQQAYVTYGSMYPMQLHSATARMTRERTRYLRQSFLHTEPGDE